MDFFVQNSIPWTTFVWSFFGCDAHFWQRSDLKRTYFRTYFRFSFGTYNISTILYIIHIRVLYQSFEYELELDLEQRGQRNEQRTSAARKAKIIGHRFRSPVSPAEHYCDFYSFSFLNNRWKFEVEGKRSGGLNFFSVSYLQSVSVSVCFMDLAKLKNERRTHFPDVIWCRLSPPFFPVRSFKF